MKPESILQLLAALVRQFSAKFSRWQRRETLALPATGSKAGDGEHDQADTADTAPKEPHETAYFNQQWQILQETTAEDVMIPRGKVDWLDIAEPWDLLEQQLAVSLHPYLPVCRETPDQLLGVLPLHRLLAERDELDHAKLLPHLLHPYYIPASTPLLTQLNFFHENRQQLGFVVDEYGDILGLLTQGDIVREMATRLMQLDTVPPLQAGVAQESVLVDANRSLRELNRSFGLEFPLEGPKTLNGLILEYFQDIPEAGVSLKISDVALEVVQTQDRSVKTVRLFLLHTLRPD
jgi:Mg2+/Co2+ transporter CorB